jgi:hypothetical protein
MRKRYHCWLKIFACHIGASISRLETQIETYLTTTGHPVYRWVRARFTPSPLQLPRPADFHIRTILYPCATASTSTGGRWHEHRDTLYDSLAGTSASENGASPWPDLGACGCADQQCKGVVDRHVPTDRRPASTSPLAAACTTTTMDSMTQAGCSGQPRTSQNMESTRNGGGGADT